VTNQFGDKKLSWVSFPQINQRASQTNRKTQHNFSTRALVKASLGEKRIFWQNLLTLARKFVILIKVWL
jgi:hypothetical protein